MNARRLAWMGCALVVGCGGGEFTIAEVGASVDPPDAVGFLDTGTTGGGSSTGGASTGGASTGSGSTGERRDAGRRDAGSTTGGEASTGSAGMRIDAGIDARDAAPEAEPREASTRPPKAEGQWCGVDSDCAGKLVCSAILNTCAEMGRSVPPTCAPGNTATLFKVTTSDPGTLLPCCAGAEGAHMTQTGEVCNCAAAGSECFANYNCCSGSCVGGWCQ